MKTFWHQSLLICLAILAVGCSTMSRGERLRVDGYPPEYVEGYEAGYTSHNMGASLALCIHEANERCQEEPNCESTRWQVAGMNCSCVEVALCPKA
jgi:hypothetical protein